MHWRWGTSERHFRDALALAPGEATVHHWYGVYLFAVGRVEQATTELRQAREIDPFSTVIATDLAIALYSARHLDEALSTIRNARELDSTASDTPVILGLIQLALGRPDSALAALETARRLGTGLDVRGYLAVSYRALGREREARSAYAELRDAYRDGRALAYDLAVGALSAGDTEGALSAVEDVIEQRHMFVTEFSLPCDPLFDSLKAHRRFREALGRAGMRMCPPRATAPR